MVKPSPHLKEVLYFGWLVDLPKKSLYWTQGDYSLDLRQQINTRMCTFQANSKAQPMLSLLSVSMMESLLSIDQCPELLSSDPIRYILHFPNLTNHWRGRMTYKEALQSPPRATPAKQNSTQETTSKQPVFYPGESSKKPKTGRRDSIR